MTYSGVNWVFWKLEWHTHHCLDNVASVIPLLSIVTGLLPAVAIDSRR